MSREGTIVFGVTIPDYITNADVYHAVDSAVERIEEEAHITTHDLVIDGLGDMVEEPPEAELLRREAHDNEDLGPHQTL